MWSPAKRVAFRFVFIYLALYCFPFPLDVLPGAFAIADACRDLLHSLAVVAAKPWVDVPVVVNNVSGDSTSNYIRVLFFFVTACTGTAVWSVLDRARTNYTVLWRALHVYMRYVLAAVMFNYGFEKVFGLQFGTPTPVRLTQTFGDASPMGLLWTFVAASPAYQFIAGAAETVGGMFLLFRRTTTLGALILIGVMGNVVLLNFCYDVPVKLYATHLWLMSVLLSLPDLPRLLNVLVLQRATAPEPQRPGKVTWRYRAAKVAAIAMILFASIGPAWESYSFVLPPPGSFDGVWEVMIPQGPGPLLTSGPAWRRISITPYGLSVIQKDGPPVRYRIAGQDGATLKLVRRDGDSAVEVPMSFELVGENEAILVNGLEGNGVGARLLRIDTTKSLLTTRGFHWINEEPFNR